MTKGKAASAPQDEIVEAPWKKQAAWGNDEPAPDPADGSGWNEEWSSYSSEDESGGLGGEPPSINLLQDAMDTSMRPGWMGGRGVEPHPPS